jgi:hypothetical protein
LGLLDDLRQPLSSTCVSTSSAGHNSKLEITITKLVKVDRTMSRGVLVAPTVLARERYNYGAFRLWQPWGQNNVATEGSRSGEVL